MARPETHPTVDDESKIEIGLLFDIPFFFSALFHPEYHEQHHHWTPLSMRRNTSRDLSSVKVPDQ
jgi:CTP synthase (UTP-ammonia lyase)